MKRDDIFLSGRKMSPLCAPVGIFNNRFNTQLKMTYFPNSPGNNIQSLAKGFSMAFAAAGPQLPGS